jgi:hypothetical protein
MARATFLATFSQSHLVTLIGNFLAARHPVSGVNPISICVHYSAEAGSRNRAHPTTFKFTATTPAL